MRHEGTRVATKLGSFPLVFTPHATLRMPHSLYQSATLPSPG